MHAKKMKMVNDIYAQTEVVKYPSEMWKELSAFCVMRHMVTSADVSALSIACKIPSKIPTSAQSKCLLKLLEKARNEGFDVPEEIMPH